MEIAGGSLIGLERGEPGELRSRKWQQSLQLGVRQEKLALWVKLRS